MGETLQNQALTAETLLEDAIDAFQRMVDLHVVAQPYPFQDGAQPDALIRITDAERTWHFAAEVKLAAEPTIPVHRPGGVARYPHKPILVTRYVNPNAAKRLRADNQPFIDTAGNAYIKEPDLYIFITGNRVAREEPRQKRTLRLNAAALRIVFHLLCCEADLNTNYRNLAEKTNTGLGTLTNYFKELRESNYIVGQGRDRHLVNQGRLFREWVNAYPRRLRPKLLRGRYRARHADWWKGQDLQQYNAYWGGEPAAARITKFLRPETVTIYTHGNLAPLIAKYELVKDARGPIEILDAFWGPYHGLALENFNVVHPILIYADLVALEDERADEAAKLIFEEHLARFEA